ncbi:uncharacterized protein ARMOST_11177 [Armillaria ostoyae]|uniref:Uncharacterized protein n=1 Tax=Armillaria ostoyae TaxID=47428 RepID=A0A284RGE1_ARMOS|nr:uncharacterized protein ARMOST_11177 [Armillaria ostoyae]
MQCDIESADGKAMIHRIIPHRRRCDCFICLRLCLNRTNSPTRTLDHEDSNIVLTMRWKSNGPVLHCLPYLPDVVPKTPVPVVRATLIVCVFSCLGHPVEYRHTHISIC